MAQVDLSSWATQSERTAPCESHAVGCDNNRRRSSLDVLRGPAQPLSVFAELPETAVTAKTEKPADFATLMIVVDMKADLAGRLAADRTPPELRCQEPLVVVQRESECPAKVAKSLGFAVLSAVLALPIVVVLAVLLLPGDHTLDLPLAVRCVPGLSARSGARLAFGSVSISGRSIAVEGFEGFGFAALLAPFLHGPDRTAGV